MKRGKTAILFTCLILLSTAVFGQVSKDEAVKRLARAIAVFRMIDGSESELISWFEIDRDNAKAVALRADFCRSVDNFLSANTDFRNLMEQVRNDESIRSDVDFVVRFRTLQSLIADSGECGQ